MRPLLQRLSILHSRHFPSAEAFLASRHIKLELSGPAAERELFDVHYNGIYLPGIWLGYIGYGSRVTAHVSPDRRDFWVHIPLNGRFESTMGKRQIEADEQRGIVTSPSGVNVLRSAPGAARLSLCIKGDALMRQLGALIDREPQAALEFAPEVDLRRGFGLSLACILRGAAADLERGDWLLGPCLASRFEQTVMSALLLSQPSNYSRELDGRASAIAPRDVGRAVDYMHAHLASPITLSELVREAGVAGRTLIKHFRDFKGSPPMRYLRDLRLKRVRAELESGKPRRVHDSALRWGFVHAGRFSVEYRRRFGESPSVTLARARGR
jgi:AraC-like DNA-binding protein